MKKFYWSEKIVSNGKKSIVTVYQQMKDGSFSYVGEIKSSRGSYRGGMAVANQILHDKFGFRWAEPPGHTHYFLKRDDIKLIALPY